MSDKKTPPSEASRKQHVRRLQRSIGIYTDPVHRVARHLRPEPGYMALMADSAGANFHFIPPGGLREKQADGIPPSLSFADGGGSPFGPEVAGGQALVIWLKPESVPDYLPREHATGVLQKRADALATVLRERLKLPLLQARVFIPDRALREKAHALGYPIGGAVLLASDTAHAEQLRVETHKHLHQARRHALGLMQHMLENPPPALSDHALEAALSPHRATFGVAKPEAIVTDNRIALADVMAHATAKPECIPLDGKAILRLRNPYGERAAPLEINLRQQKIPKDASHALLIRLDKEFRVRGPRPTSALSPMQYGDSLRFNVDRLSEFLAALNEQCGPGWKCTPLPDTKMGDLLVLTVSGEHQNLRIPHALGVLQEASIHREAEEGAWKEYLRLRGIDHNPPAQRR